MTAHRDTDLDDGPPPIGGSWRRLYIAAIVVLVIMILAAWLFSRAYS
jgi:hypothetical protein